MFYIICLLIAEETKMCSKKITDEFYTFLMLKAGNTKWKLYNFFFKTAVPTFPPPPSSMCTQPANWMCVKDPGVSIQVFTSFLEYRNVGRFCNEILFVNSMQHKRFFLCISFFYNIGFTTTDEKVFIVASVFEDLHTKSLHILCGAFLIKKI